MKISFNTAVSANKIRNTDGYGYGTERILHSLRNLGYEVTENDASADVGFVFNQPQHAKYYGDQYRIILHPWESTLMMPDWPGIMNNCDEVWSPSPLIGEWYQKYNGIVKPIYTYEHGIDSVWAPKPRVRQDKMRFLHVGGEAKRKGLEIAIKAFRLAFPDADKAGVELLCKRGSSGDGFNIIRNGVIPLNGPLPFNELLDLYYDRNIFVYPSWGEGFGFNPFQAMATGMPTITTADWAPYKRFVDPNLTIETDFTDSPFKEHPGKMFKPRVDDLVDRMRYVVDNYDSCHEFAQAQAPKIHNEYAWDTVTKTTFEALEKRLA
jgi:glycosyltransferase involved in cell wall biosynthesis